MDLLITTAHRFLRHPGSGVYTSTVLPYSFWGRYLKVFDRVFVMARVVTTPEVAGVQPRSDGDRVEFIELPDYRGLLGYLRRRRALAAAVAAAMRPPRALLARCPSPIAALACSEARRMDRPYAVEVTADPSEAFGPGASSHLLRPFLRWQYARQLRQACHGARAVGYVSGGMLPHRYPARYDAATAVYSSVELNADAFAEAPRHHLPGAATRLVTVSALNHPHKGVDVLLRALKIVRASGLEATLAVVGDGRCRSSLEALTAQFGLREYVFFHGELPGSAAVRAPLADADLFVLPSPSEGLPRTLIEAMALGLPCIGTQAGGIPELLEPDSLVPANDPAALAAAICSHAANPAGLDRISRTNLERARSFAESAIEPRRTRLYRHLLAVTEGALTRFAPAVYAAATMPRRTS